MIFGILERQRKKETNLFFPISPLWLLGYCECCSFKTKKVYRECGNLGNEAKREKKEKKKKEPKKKFVHCFFYCFTRLVI